MRTEPEVPSLIDDAEFLAELDRMDDGSPLASEAERPVAPQNPAAPQAPQRLRFEPPARPAAPPPPTTPSHPERETPPRRVHDIPARPAPVEEIGTRPRTVRKIAPVFEPPPQPAAIASVPQTRTLSTRLAALTVVLGLMVGAGSAALLFQQRVTLIVAAWSN
jgi:hypothetical protein